MKSILLIIPYFGKWPIWFEAYLVSIAKNSTINWLCPTDCEIPTNYAKNIKFLPTSLKELNNEVNRLTEANVPLTARKFCDLKPAYGDIFKEEVNSYDFWGICDMDIIWGDVRAFMTDDLLNKYDIISSRKRAISGHFNLFRNNPKINNLYKLVPEYKELFEQKKFMWFDEKVLTDYLKEAKHGLNVYWESILLNQERGIDSHQEYHLDRWLWKDGRMIDQKTSNEVMYLHFINWKRTMKFSEIKYSNFPEKFHISYNGIHYRQHTRMTIFFNYIKNIYNGYWVNDKRRIRKNKFNSFLKRVKRKLKL